MFLLEFSDTLNKILLAALFVLVLINMISIVSKQAMGRGTSYFILWAFLTFFSVYYAPEGGDVFGGMEIMDKYYINGEEEHFEPFYFRLADVLPPNYYIWRLCVWGLASLLLVLIYKKLQSPNNLATALFLMIALIPCFYYLRNSLTFSALYLSLTLICTERSNYKNIILAALLFALSYFTHKSMPLYAVIIILAIIVPMNKYAFWVPLVLLPFLHRNTLIFSEYFLHSKMMSRDAKELGMMYLSDINHFGMNIFGLVYYAVQLCPFVYLMIYAATHMSVYTEGKKYFVEKSFLNVSYFLLILSIAFIGTSSNHLFLRFSNTFMMPMSIFATIYLQDKLSMKVFRIFMILLLFCFILQLAVNII